MPDLEGHCNNNLGLLSKESRKAEIIRTEVNTSKCTKGKNQLKVGTLKKPEKEVRLLERRLRKTENLKFKQKLQILQMLNRN